MVFYRKYRPQTISELDSAFIRETLYSVLSQNEPPHAYLFTGPKGLGKTSTARIVAKVLNCEKRDKLQATSNKKNKFIEPCNECNQCKSIMNGTNLDVMEIDGASNRGIDEIRDLREKVRLAPVSARKKVYIIDEVHMLTAEAFNALLKTLEEPPAHVVFILCTTEPHKVPDTIISRCSHVAFKLATSEELSVSLKRMSVQEKITVHDNVFVQIAQLADGSFRDGAKILEELLALSNGKPITQDLVEEKYKVTSIKHQERQLLHAFLKKDVRLGFQIVSELVNQGIDIKYFIEQLVAELHQLLLFKVGVVKNDALGITNSELEIEDIKKLIELFTKAYGELKYAVLPSLPLELAIVEWGGVQTDVHQNSQDFTLTPKGRGSPKDISSIPSPFQGESKKVVKSASVSYSNIWNQFVEKVKAHNHTIAGVLRGCSLQAFDGKEFIIHTNYAFHKDRLNEKKSYDVLKNAAREVSGNDVEVKVILVRV